jgi:hypothetical protein
MAASARSLRVLQKDVRNIAIQRFLSEWKKYRLDETAAGAARMPNSQARTVASSSSPASRTGYAMNASSMN